MSAALTIVGIIVGLFACLVVRSFIQEFIVDAWSHMTYDRRIKRAARKRHR